MKYLALLIPLAGCSTPCEMGLGSRCTEEPEPDPESVSYAVPVPPGLTVPPPGWVERPWEYVPTSIRLTTSQRLVFAWRRIAPRVFEWKLTSAWMKGGAQLPAREEDRVYVAPPEDVEDHIHEWVRALERDWRNGAFPRYDT